MMIPDPGRPLTGPKFHAAWGLRRLGLPACWQQVFTGAGVRIGHLDTGVDGSHPALSGRIAGVMEYDLDGFPIPGASPHDTGSHGTHTAGIICGGTCDRLAIGAAPDARLYSAAVIEGGKCLVRLLAGLDWMLDCQVQVVCISFGLTGYNPLFEIALSRMRRAGILVIAPVGNRGSGHSRSPANYSGVLAVGAASAQDRVAHFSGSQLFRRTDDCLKPNLVAPGVGIPSAQPGGRLQTQSGTSMAAALVAGVAALLYQAKAGATAAEVGQALLSACTPLPDSSPRRCGSGLVNPQKALEALTSSSRSYSGWQPT